MVHNKLSIITICYNEPNLEKTCESIVNQTWQDFEWIVIDGGSNEETQKIWNKYKYRIDKFISEPDNGIYNAMNKGIKIATGEYLNFLNAGDYYNDSNVLKYVTKNCLKIDIEYLNLKVINPDNITKIYTYPKVIDKNFLITYSLPHPSSFIKKALFDKYGLYDEEYIIISDWKKWIEFIYIHKCSYKHINHTCSVFNINGISSINNELSCKERNEVLSKYFTQEEIELAYKLQKINYTFLEQIFSIKNSFDKKKKIITILGIHIVIIKRKHK